ncbi:hypothetical protein E3N88_15730 [Mikania micrantha]|uniref:Uncharacterized protein n=1 Tax=Mikania micrantha TaxID=192012 RepID=A0A5N6NW88_9ASTR|nr:hypothetical protein E3N88_15730 [Mikania micrantha]
MVESSRRTVVNSTNDIPNNHKCQYDALRRTVVNSTNSGITKEDRSQLNNSNSVIAEDRSSARYTQVRPHGGSVMGGSASLQSLSTQGIRRSQSQLLQLPAVTPRAGGLDRLPHRAEGSQGAISSKKRGPLTGSLVQK